MRQNLHASFRSGITIIHLDYGFTKYEGDARWRIPISFQGIFAVCALGALCTFPDTPRWYYARGKFVKVIIDLSGGRLTEIFAREAEGDAVLCQLNNKPLYDPFVQQTKREIHSAIASELAASKSLDWIQFLTFGLFDRSPERLIRRLSMCFWITFLRQWAVGVFFRTLDGTNHDKTLLLRRVSIVRIAFP